MSKNTPFNSTPNQTIKPRMILTLSFTQPSVFFADARESNRTGSSKTNQPNSSKICGSLPSKFLWIFNAMIIVFLCEIMVRRRHKTYLLPLTSFEPMDAIKNKCANPLPGAPEYYCSARASLGTSFYPLLTTFNVIIVQLGKGNYDWRKSFLILATSRKNIAVFTSSL